MWILQEPKKIALRNKRHLEEGKNGECAACLKYSVSIFVELIFKMQRLEVSCAVRHIYIVRRQRVKIWLQWRVVYVKTYVHFNNIFVQFFSEWEMFQRKSCIENQNTLFIFNIFFHENRAVYEIMCGEPCGTGQATYGNIIWWVHFACWKTKAANTQPEHVIRIAIPLQRWLQERSTMLCYKCIACSVLNHKILPSAVKTFRFNPHDSLRTVNGDNDK